MERTITNFLVIFPSFIIGIFSIYLAAVDATERYLKSEKFTKLDLSIRTKRRKFLCIFIKGRVYVYTACGLILLTAFIWWLIRFFDP